MTRALAILVCVSAAAAESQPDMSPVIARILRVARQTSTNLPRYMCVETITREYYSALAPVSRSCDTVVEAQEHPTLDTTRRHTSTDRLRLEVALSSKGEIHAWPGEARFNDARIDAIVRDGPMGTGAFGAYFGAIFEGDAKAFRLVGRTVVNGRRRVQFAFDVPKADSHYLFKVPNDWVATAYSGVFDADEETGEIAWLELKTAVLPEALGTCLTTTHLDLGRTAIGGGSFLVTTRARQQFLDRTAGMVTSTIEFSGCREYRGESTITFETDAPLAEGTATKAGLPSKKPAAIAVPSEIPFTLDLDAPLDSATAAGGDRFTAHLAADLGDRWSGRVARRGARVEGRILRVQSFYGDKPECLFVLRPETVEIRGVKVPLAATQNLRYVPGQQRPVAGSKKGALIILPFSWETNAGLFRFPGAHAVMKRGYRTYWRTTYRAR